MVGTLRFVLAMMVLANHLYYPVANQIGSHAVVGFYIISGYLMTMVIHDVYGTDARGVSRFLLNRFLRIYPAYLLFLGATLLGLATVSGFSIYSLMTVPDTWQSWFANVTLINLTWQEQIVIPPAWSLGVECFFYIAMPLLLARHRAGIVVWMVVSLVFTIYLNVIGASFADRYYPVYSASLFFSIGACIRMFEGHLRFSLKSALWYPGVVLFALFPILVDWVGMDRFTIGYYGATALFIGLYIAALNRERAQPSLRKGLRRVLGDMAYPVFLGHFFVGAIVNRMGLFETGGLVFFLVSAAAMVGVSWLYLRTVDHAVNRVRARVRARAAAGQPATVGAVASGR